MIKSSPQVLKCFANTKLYELKYSPTQLNAKYQRFLLYIDDPRRLTNKGTTRNKQLTTNHYNLERNTTGQRQTTPGKFGTHREQIQGGD